jgi:hypothetical protein
MTVPCRFVRLSRDTIIFPTEICLPLLRPLHGERPHQHRQRHVRRLPSSRKDSAASKEYISETIDDPEALCDPEIWDTPGFTLVLSWLAQKWLRKCHKPAPRGTKNPNRYLTKEQQKAYLDSAAAELIREITQKRLLN